MICACEHSGEERAMAAPRDPSPIGEHDWHSDDYVEAWIARDAARDAERREQLAALLAHTKHAGDAALAVLDVGGGFGVVTQEVLRALPRAHVTLQDYSAPMLEKAKERLAAHAGQVDYALADLFDPDWTGRVGGPFDVAISAIAIHNLRDVAAMASVYRGVAQVLKPDGVFLDYDLFFERTGGLAHHMDLLRDAGFARVECLWQRAPLASLAAYRG
jgi:ubiquinone/menaquinone biosynthesis C-methylase UbiE